MNCFFFLMGLSRYYILGHELIELTWVDSSFFYMKIKINFFFMFAFHHLTCLKVDLYNQFFFSMGLFWSYDRTVNLTCWLMSGFLSILKCFFSSSFNVCFAGNWASDFIWFIFLFIRLYCMIIPYEEITCVHGKAHVTIM